MKRIYLAGPLFTLAEREFNTKLATELIADAITQSREGLKEEKP